MPKPQKPQRRRNRKRTAKIKVSERFKLVHKNDATRVSNPRIEAQKRAPVQLADDNGANFKIKIKRRKK